jgi:hypothetical protein
MVFTGEVVPSNYIEGYHPITFKFVWQTGDNMEVQTLAIALPGGTGRLNLDLLDYEVTDGGMAFKLTFPAPKLFGNVDMVKSTYTADDRLDEDWQRRMHAFKNLLMSKKPNEDVELMVTTKVDLDFEVNAVVKENHVHWMGTHGGETVLLVDLYKADMKNYSKKKPKTLILATDLA